MIETIRRSFCEKYVDHCLPLIALDPDTFDASNCKTTTWIVSFVVVLVLLSSSAFTVVVFLQSTLDGMAWVNAHWAREVCKVYCVDKADCSASAGSESMKGLVRVGAVFLCFFVSLFPRCLFCCLFLCRSDTVCVFACFRVVLWLNL